MYAFKHRPAEDFIERRRTAPRDALTGGSAFAAVPSPARAMQARLADAVTGAGTLALAVPPPAATALSVRARFAIIAALGLACWVPVLGAGLWFAL